jgi:hypothetical protein
MKHLIKLLKTAREELRRASQRWRHTDTDVVQCHPVHFVGVNLHQQRAQAAQSAACDARCIADHRLHMRKQLTVSHQCTHTCAYARANVLLLGRCSEAGELLISWKQRIRKFAEELLN